MDLKILLMVLSALVILLLGCAHLVFTFLGSRLHPRDPALIKTMQATSLVITRETSVWRAWIGFNASHSMAAILFGSVYGYLVLAHPSVLFGSGFLQWLGLGVLVGFLGLAKAYWFRVPLLGIGLALLCYVASVTLAHQ